MFAVRASGPRRPPPSRNGGGCRRHTLYYFATKEVLVNELYRALKRTGETMCRPIRKPMTRGRRSGISGPSTCIGRSKSAEVQGHAQLRVSDQVTEESRPRRRALRRTGTAGQGLHQAPGDTQLPVNFIGGCSAQCGDRMDFVAKVGKSRTDYCARLRSLLAGHRDAAAHCSLRLICQSEATSFHPRQRRRGRCPRDRLVAMPHGAD